MKNRPHLTPDLIAAVMLLIATAELPYGYYTFLRWVICGISIFIACSAYGWGGIWASWLFGLIALLFNPLIPIHLTREIWQPIDTVCAVLFGVSTFTLKKPVIDKG